MNSSWTSFHKHIYVYYMYPHVLTTAIDMVGQNNMAMMKIHELKKQMATLQMCTFLFTQ